MRFLMIALTAVLIQSSTAAFAATNACQEVANHVYRRIDEAGTRINPDGSVSKNVADGSVTYTRTAEKSRSEIVEVLNPSDAERIKKITFVKYSGKGKVRNRLVFSLNEKCRIEKIAFSSKTHQYDLNRPFCKSVGRNLASRGPSSVVDSNTLKQMAGKSSGASVRISDTKKSSMVSMSIAKACHDYASYFSK